MKKGAETLNGILKQYFQDPPRHPGDPTEAALRQHIQNMSEKEQLRWLNDNRHITDLQMRTVARAMNDGASLSEALDALEHGELAPPSFEARDPQLKRNLKKLADVPAGMSDKQKLLWLRDNAAITVQQMRQAAAYLDRGIKIDKALQEAGAVHVLESVLPPEKKAPALTIGEVLAKTIPQLKEYIVEVDDPKMVLQLLSEEINDKNREWGRKVLIRRAVELGATDAEIEEAVIQPERRSAADDGERGDAAELARRDMERTDLDLDDDDDEEE